MKKTQFIDCIRNIAKQKVSFLSIILIAIMGVTAFLGIGYTSTALRKNDSDVYDSLNFRDIEMVSTLLFSDEDIRDIRGVEGVKDVEPVRYTGAKLCCADERESVNVISVSNRINLSVPVKGRLPKGAGECAVEQKTADELGLKVGDKIALINVEGNTAEYLGGSDYVITGIAKHADHINILVPDLAYVFVSLDAFDSKALDGCYMKAEVVIEKPEKINRFSEEYEELVAKVMSRMDKLSVPTTARRVKEVKDKASKDITDGERTLDEAHEKLEDARRQLDEKTRELKAGEKELTSGETKLAAAKKELDSGSRKLEKARAEIESGKATLNAEKKKLVSGKAKLDSSKAKLDSGKQELQNGFAEIENAKAKIRNVIKGVYERIFKSEEAKKLIKWAPVKTADTDDADETAKYLYITDTIRFDLSRKIEDVLAPIVNSVNVPDKLLVAIYEAALKTDAPKNGDDYDIAAIKSALLQTAATAFDGYTKLSNACIEWDNGHSEYISGLSEYKSGLKLYNDGLKKFSEGEAKIASGEKEYKSGLKLYNEQKRKYEQGIRELESGRKRIEEGKAKIAEGEAEYENGLTEYDEGKSKLAEAKKQFDKIETCKWLLFDSRGNASFVQTVVGSENFSNIKMTFSLMFVAVGALVIFATVGKIVDEQRTRVGTAKALGFFNREIFAKYIIFGVSATVIGAFLSIAAAYFVIEPMMLNGFAKYYLFDISKPTVSIGPAVVALIAGVILSFISVWFASVKLLREPAVRLMQPKMPGGSKKTGGKGRLSLYSRLILLNMRTDLKRVVVTVVSVAGCCALIIIGVTLKSSLNNSEKIHYNEILQYDVSVEYDAGASDAESKIENILNAENTKYVKLRNENVTYRVDGLSVAELFCGDIKSLDKFYRIRDWKTGKPFGKVTDGVIVQRRFAELYNLDKGSKFEVTLRGTKTVKLYVAGVFENYIGRGIVMSPEYYNQVFDEDVTYNRFFVKTGNVNAADLEKQLKKIDGFEGVTPFDDDRSVVEASNSMVNSVVVLFIVIAAVMALVVQLNLTNMYINGKKRELIIMRINGFTVKEVNQYVIRETVLTTVLGILSGFAIGTAVAYRIIRILEQAFFQFDRRVNPVAWIIAAILTVAFTAIVNAIALRKTKALKLTDIQ